MKQGAIFLKKIDNEEKTVHMSILPPCASVLRLHWKKANFFAAISKNTTTVYFQFPDAIYHGWNSDLFYGLLISFQRRLNEFCLTVVMIQKMSMMPLEIVIMKNYLENSFIFYLHIMCMRYVFACCVWITF